MKNVGATLSNGRSTMASENHRPNAREGWKIPAALILINTVPIVGGLVRLAQLAGGAEITPDNERFFASPLPVALHIVGVSLYGILGAFQFAPAFRRRRPGWHRAAGRLLVPCGLVAALSGLWMTAFYPLPEHDRGLLAVFRVGVGLGWILALALGVTAIRRRDFARHGAWMIRAYAIGLGAGTQSLVLLPWNVILGPPGALGKALVHGACWAINLAVAEWIIRRRLAQRQVRVQFDSHVSGNAGLYDPIPSGQQRG